MPALNKYYCYACEIQFNKNFEPEEDLKCTACGSGAIEQLTNTIGLEDEPDPAPEYVEPPAAATGPANPLPNPFRNMPFPFRLPMMAGARRTTTGNTSNSSTATANASAATAANPTTSASNITGTRGIRPGPPDNARQTLMNFLNNAGPNTTITETNPTQGVNIQHITTTGGEAGGETNNDGAGMRNHMITITMDASSDPANIYEAIRNQLAPLVTAGAPLISGSIDANGQTINLGQNPANYVFGDMESIINRLMQDSSNSGRRPASEDTIAAIESHELGKRTYNRLKEENNLDCAICMAPFEATTLVKKLSCGHIFHCDCVDSWLRVQSNCPVCRAEVTPPPRNLEGGAAGNPEGPHPNARPRMHAPNFAGMPEGLQGSILDVMSSLTNLVSSAGNPQPAGSQPQSENQSQNQNQNNTRQSNQEPEAERGRNTSSRRDRSPSPPPSYFS